MKLKYIYILGLLFTVTFSSCSEDFLDVDSTTSLTVDDYYTTEARIYESLVAAYDPLNWCDYYYSYSQYEMVSDIMGDDIHVGGANESDMNNFHRISNYEAQASSIGLNNWVVYYSGIKRANDVIYYMDGVEDISDENKALYLAEAKTLRALYYLRLWKLWGNIPYYETNLEPPYIAPQLTADEVYENIIATLEDAINNGGMPMKATADTYGRMTQAIAYMLYTEAVMYQNDDARYEQALAYMNEIISSGEYSLVSDYASLWTEEGEWGSESIMEINYFRVNASRSWSNPTGDGGTVYPRFIGINSMSDPTGKYDSGWGFGPVRKVAYDMYDDADTRRDGSILDIQAYMNATGATYSPRYEDEGYFLDKYIAQQAMNEGQVADADLNFGNNIRVYRYSEVLLNAAELLAQGVTGDGSAQQYLDEVRTRAGVASVTASVDNILNERRLEFVGEGKRYWDLVRSGKAASVLVPNDYRTNTWSENKKYLPIPLEEMDSDPNLVQNNY